MSQLLLSDFDYELPDNRVAKFPLDQRDLSQLLVYKNGVISDHVFSSLASHLPDNALLVFNNTKVIPARLFFKRSTGAHIEVLCLEPTQPFDIQQSMGTTSSCVWKCMLGNAKRFKVGETLCLALGNNLVLKARRLESKNEIEFSWNQELVFSEVLAKAGMLPLPPYLNRENVEADRETYQTVYAKNDGAVAAPTAGLHFTKQVFDSLKQKCVSTAEVTLHVGAGTFLPVKTDDITQHQMHGEHFLVNKNTLEQLANHQGPIIPVGTTSLRTLESMYYLGIRQQNQLDIPVGQHEPYQVVSPETREMALRNLLALNLEEIKASTEIMIRPGYDFKVIDGLVTNFHQPKSTLVMLIAALVGETWREIYNHALNNNYRFLSYGDSSLLLP
ncbi:MAG: tRNA preQ1(34) S-adenosylmethionine ribosyltransferase-isomerase QueA [Bacteroidetes bacterium]|nr:tRNA preQ1(34) S-adenosylmethionine ribosyltransferase-isomerase QueA [Bacteroidota bacterium]